MPDYIELEALTQRYFSGKITSEELTLLQKILSEDADCRSRFLLHAQVEVTLDDMVLFHNYMEKANVLGSKAEESPVVAEAVQEQVPSRFKLILRRFLGMLHTNISHYYNN